jgi:hypothetical protein
MAVLWASGMEVKVNGYGRLEEASVVVNRNGIVKVAFCAKVAIGSYDDSYSIVNPFVRLQYKSQFVEPANREG